MMARSALIRAVFVVLLVLLATSAQAHRNHRHRPRPRPRVNPINTCKEQSKCIRFTVKEVNKYDDRLCTNEKCAYKVCLILDTRPDECPKEGNNGKIASTCVAKKYRCNPTSYRQRRNKGRYYKQCQIGAPDSELKFYLGDGPCRGYKTLRVPVAKDDDAEEAVITCSRNKEKTCTRKKIRECMWKVKLPPCPAPEQCKVRYCEECLEDNPYKCAKCETGYYKKWRGHKCVKCKRSWANWWPTECKYDIAATAVPDDVVDPAQTAVPEDDVDTAQTEVSEDDDDTAQNEETEDDDDAAMAEETEDDDDAALAEETEDDAALAEEAEDDDDAALAEEAEDDDDTALPEEAEDDAAQADVPEDADNVAQGDVPQDV